MLFQLPTSTGDRVISEPSAVWASSHCRLLTMLTWSFIDSSRCHTWFNGLPSLKLAASWHLKIDGWSTIVSFWDGLFSGANLLVSGRVYKVYKWKCLEIGWSDDSADMMRYPVSVKSFVPPKAITLFVWSILLWAMDAWIYLFTLIHANQLQGGSRRFKIDVVFSSMIFGVHHKNLVTWENQP